MAAVNDVGSSQQMTEKTEGKTAYEENKKLSVLWDQHPVRKIL